MFGGLTLIKEGREDPLSEVAPSLAINDGLVE